MMFNKTNKDIIKICILIRWEEIEVLAGEERVDFNFERIYNLDTLQKLKILEWKINSLCVFF